MPKVDLSHYQGREQAYIKHCLLEEYLPDWAYKVGSAWDSLVYVDGFAGPWRTIDQDYADSSFGIAVETLRQCQKGLLESRQRELRMQCILVDRDKTAFSHLQKFAIEKSSPGFGVHALKGEFVRNIAAIEKIVASHTQNPFRFVFLDPKGWADIPILKLKPFLQSRSCEVLINLMTRHIIAFWTNQIVLPAITTYSVETKCWAGYSILRFEMRLLLNGRNGRFANTPEVSDYYVISSTYQQP